MRTLLPSLATVGYEMALPLDGKFNLYPIHPLEEGHPDTLWDVRAPDDLEAMLDRDFEKFADVLNSPQGLPHWRESVVVLNCGEPEVTTSYEVQAIRAGMVEEKVPIGVGGVIVTDEGVLMGIRGGQYKSETASIAPSGSMMWLPEQPKNLIFGNFYKELAEEVGVLPHEVRGVALIGGHTDPSSRSLQYTLIAKSSVPARELRQRHHNFMQAYGGYLGRIQAPLDDSAGLSDIEISDLDAELIAREALKQEGFVNHDAWENKMLVTLDAHARRQIIISQMLNLEGKQHGVLPSGYAPLLLFSRFVPSL